MKHTRVIFGTWIVFCAWVLLACRSSYLSAEAGAEPADIAASVPLVLGLPSWVFWGIAVPWFVASTFTIVYALFGIREEQHDAN